MSDFLESLLLRGTVPTPDLAAGSIQPRPLSLYEVLAKDPLPSDLEADPGLAESYDFPPSDGKNPAVRSIDENEYHPSASPSGPASMKHAASAPGPEETGYRLRQRHTPLETLPPTNEFQPPLENFSPVIASRPSAETRRPAAGTRQLSDKETLERRALDIAEPADELAPRSSPSTRSIRAESSTPNQPARIMLPDPFPKGEGSSALPIRPLLPNDPGSNREMNGRRMPGLEMDSSSETHAAPSIQVSIGRIEVRLTQPLSAPGRQPSRRTSAVMSLEEYLRQRDGGRS